MQTTPGSGPPSKGPRPTAQRARLVDLTDRGPLAVLPASAAIPAHLRIAVREGAVPGRTVSALEKLWQSTWMVPAVGPSQTLRLIQEFPADVLVLPEEDDMAATAAAAREPSPDLKILAAVPDPADLRSGPSWAELAVPADADPGVWILALIGLQASSTGSPRWEWVQTTLTVVDGAYRGLFAIEPGEKADAAAADLRRRVEGYFEILLRVVLDRADRDIEGFAGRSFRIADMARRTAETLRMGADEIETVRLAGLFHDVGMHLVLSAESLGRQGPLRGGEWELVRSHPDVSAAATAPFRSRELASAILDHHERLDGTGYPQGKRGDKVSPTARIVAVADAFDAMTHPRPHRPRVSAARAVQELSSQAAAGLIDPDVVDALPAEGSS